MDGAVEVMGVEDLGQCHGVARVGLIEGRTHARDFLYAVERLAVAVGEVVGHYYIVTCVYELHGDVRAYETGAAGNQNCLFHDHSN